VPAISYPTVNLEDPTERSKYAASIHQLLREAVVPRAFGPVPPQVLGQELTGSRLEHLMVGLVSMANSSAAEAECMDAFCMVRLDSCIANELPQLRRRVREVTGRVMHHIRDVPESFVPTVEWLNETATFIVEEVAENARECVERTARHRA
jgi:hypothetical protein